MMSLYLRDAVPRFEWRSFFNAESKHVLFDLADAFQSHLTTQASAAMVQSQ